VPQARVHVLFFGRVQGVGFRYTARALAERHRVVGFVRNLSDGRVELEAEGSVSEVEAYLEELRRTFGRSIHDSDVRRLTPTGEYRRFAVHTSSGW
jgi:acylphosphatase